MVKSAQKSNGNVWNCRTDWKTERQLVFIGLMCVRSYKNKQTNKNKNKETNKNLVLLVKWEKGDKIDFRGYCTPGPYF